MRALPHHYESVASIPATAQSVFSHLDDHARLSSHMSRASWAMGGGRMEVITDEALGRSVGSHIRMTGRVFGIRVSLEEVVTERDVPRRKVWETIGLPRLLVIGQYRMGFDITPQGGASQVCVFIDYALPESAPLRWLGRLFGRYYARWCTQRMVSDAVSRFRVREPLRTIKSV